MPSDRTRASDETIGRRSACDECRSRHIKCDSLRPTCTPCQSSSRWCRTKIEFKFRHDHNPSFTESPTSSSRQKSPAVAAFGQDQSWVSIPSELKFVWNTDDLGISGDAPSTADDGALLDSDGSESGGSDPEDFNSSISPPPRHSSVQDYSTVQAIPRTSLHPVDEIGSHSAQDISTFTDTLEVDCTSRSGNPPSGSLDIFDPLGPDIPLACPDNDVASDAGQLHAPHGYPAAQTRHIDHEHDSPIIDSQSPGLWPLGTLEEAKLLRHFITDLSMWFDYCDPVRHFANVVVSIAAADSTLLYAILAVSARHLSLKGSVNRHVSDEYQRRCLEELIPALNVRDSALSETIFAATVVLRLLDEMTEHTEPTEIRGHILGTHILVRAREDLTSNSSLRAAALVVGLRQEIFLSFMTRVPVQQLADYCGFDRSLSPASDRVWALRMIAHTADVLNYCYSGEPRTSASWEKLQQYAEMWSSHRPPSFNPIRCVAAEPSAGNFFPEIWLLNDCHVAGLQYYSVCRILMLAHDPYIPSLGPDRHEVMRAVDERIRDQIRILCGIALSNERFMPAKLTAGMAIAMCGERFIDPVEQNQLIAILIDTEEHIAWPFLRFQETVKRQWGRV